MCLVIDASFLWIGSCQPRQRQRSVEVAVVLHAQQVKRNQTGSGAAAALQSLRRLPIKYVSVRGIDEERNFVTRFQEETFLDHGINQIKPVARICG
jgi:hypothetical protein